MKFSASKRRSDGKDYAVHFEAANWNHAEWICKLEGYHDCVVLIAEGDLPDMSETAGEALQ